MGSSHSNLILIKAKKQVEKDKVKKVIDMFRDKRVDSDEDTKLFAGELKSMGLLFDYWYLKSVLILGDYSKTIENDCGILLFLETHRSSADDMIEEMVNVYKMDAFTISSNDEGDGSYKVLEKKGIKSAETYYVNTSVESEVRSNFDKIKKEEEILSEFGEELGSKFMELLESKFIDSESRYAE